MVPGPRSSVDVGDKVQIVLHNQLPMGTDIHFHGVTSANSMDGVAPITQDSIEPGESFTYEFTADEPSVAHVPRPPPRRRCGPERIVRLVLRGRHAAARRPDHRWPGVPADVEVSQEIPMVLNDAGVIGLTLNGKSFPATAPIVANDGDWVDDPLLQRGHCRSTRCTSTSSPRS